MSITVFDYNNLKILAFTPAEMIKGDTIYWYPDGINTILVEPGIGGRRYILRDPIAELGELSNSHKLIRTNPPPNNNFKYYISEATGQWRKEPAREPQTMREGIHAAFGAVLGAIVGGTMVVTSLGNGEMQMAIVAALVIGVMWATSKLFVDYETTEEDVIADWGYRDIGGFLTGFKLTTAPSAIASLIILAARFVW